MSDIAIQVENLSKKYIISHQQTDGYATLRDKLSEGIQALGKGLFASKQTQLTPAKEEFWALKDVSFEVKQGDRLGIIGRNGAGKSTLLKILSRITEPTSGEITINGRIASLLEVGTGFHPELTGRENIFLNGAILGMGRTEIRKKFDEIVAFAEIEKFLDTPVKRYSSGMYVRLAFAVAAHLEPEILIVDEVLAVGDSAFQKKCLGKMEHVSREGRTILFVSHNMGIVQTLCNRGILLHKGEVASDDTSTNVVAYHLRLLENLSSQDLQKRTERDGKGNVKFSRIEITTGDNSSNGTLVPGYPARFIFHITGVVPRVSCSFTIYDQLGQPVTYFDSAIHSEIDLVCHQGKAQFICEIDELLLIPGRYRINAALKRDQEYEDDVKAAAFFDVEQGRIRARPVPEETGYGSVLLQHRWITPV